MLIECIPAYTVIINDESTNLTTAFTLNINERIPLYVLKYCILKNTRNEKKERGKESADFFLPRRYLIV